MTDYENAVQAWLSGRSASGGGTMPESFRMQWAAKRSPDHIAALDRMKAWTRERFGLAEEATIMVAEVACGLPGCPPVETVVAFWTAADTRHHFKVFKPAFEVLPDDLPPSWMKNALIALDGVDCECC